ncbi:MAG: LamG-like jellyroll fold domain-containing protein [Verrucomicrobiota bacterium JB024]|nr:LamG-like jellyroll fold domain-containing protein [Verrucomicrobiota bacterium JB024]
MYKTTILLLCLSSLAGYGWTVSFDNGFTSDTGQDPVNTWQAKKVDTGVTGPGVLLEKAGRLSYASKDESGAFIIAPVAGCVEFDFLPREPGTMIYAAFDSGNIRITGHGKGVQLNAVLALNNGEKAKLVAPGGTIKIGEWNRVTLRYDLLKPKSQISLEVNGVVVAVATVTGTRLADGDDKFHWGVYGWGGNPWNGIYDNLKIE